MLRRLLLRFSLLGVMCMTPVVILAEAQSDIQIDIQAGAQTAVLVPDASTVPEAVERIKQRLERQGLEIALVVDHAAAAAGVNLELAPTQVIFARQVRFVEAGLLRRGQTIGIDLPLKFLVFERDGKVQVTSNSLGYLLDRHSLKTRDPLLRHVYKTIRRFAAAPNGLLSVESLRTFEDTVYHLQAAIQENPAFRIPLVLDYGAKRDAWHKAGRHRSPVLIVFGNPNAGTPLMQADQRIGIDLPQKFLVWQDHAGGVHISYNDPAFLAARHDIQGQDARLQAIAGALRRFALAGAGRDEN